MTDATKFPPPPKGLQPETEIWWREVVREYVLEPSHLKLLTLACRAWDRQLEARAALKKNGLTFADRHGVLRSRPEIVIERNASVLFSRLLRELRLDAAPDEAEQRIPRNAVQQQRRTK